MQKLIITIPDEIPINLVETFVKNFIKSRLHNVLLTPQDKKRAIEEKVAEWETVFEKNKVEKPVEPKESEIKEPE